MAVKLSERLLAAASLIRGGGIVADIGTDHGYLPVYLIENGIIKKAFGADIGKMPLENAAKAVEYYNLSDKIELRLSDGLKEFSPDEADEFVFAGMGGTLIKEKLAETPWVKNPKYHFVFQPQSRAEDLREFLFENGFTINSEIAVCEGRRVYIAFDASYTGETVKYTLADCFIGKLKPDENAKLHIKNQMSRLLKKYNANAGTQKEQAELEEIIEAMKEFINA